MSHAESDWLINFAQGTSLVDPGTRLTRQNQDVQCIDLWYNTELWFMRQKYFQIYSTVKLCLSRCLLGYIQWETNVTTDSLPSCS